MIDYLKTVIYKIEHNENKELLYVGHTTQYTRRKAYHKSQVDQSDRKIYKMIRENGGWDSFEMKPIMEYSCENKVQACIQEEKSRVELQANMNAISCIYNEKLQKENRAKYRQVHLEERHEKAKEYYQEHKEERKAYRKSIKEEQKEYKKKWYAENKAKINELRYQKYKCECGCEISKTNKSQHEKMKVHKAYIDSLNLIII